MYFLNNMDKKGRFFLEISESVHGFGVIAN
jgi:hypothetical protein